MKRIAILIISILFSSCLYAQAIESMTLSNSGAHFTYGNASFDFNRAGSIVVQVGKHFLSMTRVGDEQQGMLILRSGRQVMKTNYVNNGDGPVFDNEGLADVFIGQFYASLSQDDQAGISTLRSFMGSCLSGGSPQEKDNARPETDCTANRNSAILAFVACPASFGLGCVAGAYFLYEEWESC